MKKTGEKFRRLLLFVFVLSLGFIFYGNQAYAAGGHGGGTGESPLAPGDYGTYYTFENRKVMSIIRHKFVGYSKATPYWSKASQYTVSPGDDEKFSLSIGAFGQTFKMEYSFHSNVSISIPANPARYSRLGFYDDFRVVRTSGYIHENGTKRFVGYYYNLEKIPGRTKLQPVYR